MIHDKVHLENPTIPTFPCKVDKSPLTKRGFKDATAAAQVWEKWLRRWPSALRGMPTGRPSLAWVLDIDPRHGGLESLAALEREHGPLPKDAPRVRTRSGGLHVYFAVDPDGPTIPSSAGRIAPGVDVRGEGAYVITASSEGWDYIGEAREAKVAPAWLVAATARKVRTEGHPGMGRRDGAVSGASAADLDGPPIQEGTRNASLFSIAGRLHDGRRDPLELTNDLLEVNTRRCTPPLPEDEVVAMAQNIFHKYRPCRPSRESRPTTPLDAQTMARLDAIESMMWDRVWAGQGGKTDRDVYIVALKIARRYGRSIPVGVRVSLSLREWAPMAGTSKTTLLKAIDRLRKAGLLRRDDAERRGVHAGSIVLLAPRERVDHSVTATQITPPVDASGQPSRAPLSAPRLRWGTAGAKPRRGLVNGTRMVRKGVPPSFARRDKVRRLGKGAGAILDAVEANGGTISKARLGEVLGAKRPRDLWRDPIEGVRKMAEEAGRAPSASEIEEASKKYCGPGAKLVRAGVVEDQGDSVALGEDWLQALDIERERGGEIEREQHDRENYERDRLAWRKRYRRDDVSRHAANAHADGFSEELIPMGPAPTLEQLYAALHAGQHIGTPDGRGKVWQAFSNQVGVVLDASPEKVTFYHPGVLTGC